MNLNIIDNEQPTRIQRNRSKVIKLTFCSSEDYVSEAILNIFLKFFGYQYLEILI